MDQEVIQWRAEIAQAGANGELLTKCWTATCMQMRIASWPEGQWVDYPSGIPARVSHGICPECAKIWDQKVEEFFQKEEL